jgi:hypothetical protein
VRLHSEELHELYRSTSQDMAVKMAWANGRKYEECSQIRITELSENCQRRTGKDAEGYCSETSIHHFCR